MAAASMAFYIPPIEPAHSLEPTMSTTASPRTSAAAVALSLLVTVATLGGIQSLATQPAADSLLSSRSVSTQVVSTQASTQAKG